MRGLLIFLTVVFTTPSFAMHRNDSWIPQTRTLDEGVFQVSLDRHAQVQKKKEDPIGMGHESTLGTSYGIWQKDIVGVEGGLDWIEPAAEQVVQGVFAHVRIRVSDVEKDGWAVATGIERMGFVANKNDVNMMYVTMQNRFADRWFAGVGGYSGSSRFLVDHNGKEDSKGVFLGIWRQIQKGRGRLNFEHQAGASFVGVSSLGMTLELADGIHGTVCYALSNNQKLVRDFMLAKISVDF